jgi:hypothetical protein
MVLRSIKLGVCSDAFLRFDDDDDDDFVAEVEAAAAAAIACVLLVEDDVRESDGLRPDDTERESDDEVGNELPGDAPEGPLIDDLRRLEMRIGRLDDDPEDGVAPLDTLVRIEFIMRASIMCAMVLHCSAHLMRNAERETCTPRERERGGGRLRCLMLVFV